QASGYCGIVAARESTWALRPDTGPPGRAPDRALPGPRGPPAPPAGQGRAATAAPAPRDVGREPTTGACDDRSRASCRSKATPPNPFPNAPGLAPVETETPAPRPSRVTGHADRRFGTKTWQSPPLRLRCAIP